MSSNVIAACRDVRKSYRMPHGTLQVLDGVSVDIQRGERFCMMGASGAGKSTLLHLLAGLDRPNEGTVQYEGEEFHSLSESRRASIRAREMGFVFQSYHLMPDLNVLENVILPARALRGYGAKAGEVREEAKRLLDEVGLSERLQHRPMELSGGEQQRVAIARALINQPAILFADEPTGNLDDKTGGHVLEQLFSLSDSMQLTLVMVTHSRPIGEQCDRLLRLDAGQVVV